jgi:hypothetical protein
MNWKRFLHYEFWPYWVFYFPAYFYYFYLALKSRRWVYFSVLNPCMKFGGAFLSSKQNYLKKIAPEWTPKTLHVSDLEDFESIKNQLKAKNLNFPLIAKPDMGERGRNVEKMESLNELELYLKKIDQSVLIQEYIDYPIEIGILFYWDTNRIPQITSVGKKEFCKLIGDGKRTLEILVNENHRIAHRASILKDRFETQWHQIIPKGKELLVEPIGNHNRGTTFLDAREHKTKEMLDWIEICLQNLPDFDYGRIDLKIKNWNAFKDNTGIKILEINGVNSEPIHIYDPCCSIWSAYKTIFNHMHIIYKLSQQKLNTQSQTPSLFEFITGAREVLSKKEVSQISYT